MRNNIATYITEQKVTAAADAAVSANENVLLHKSSFRERSVARDVSGWTGKVLTMTCSVQGKLVGLNLTLKQVAMATLNTCNYCHEKGHWRQIVLC